MPYEAAADLVRRRYMTIPQSEELSDVEFIRLSKKALQESLYHVPNRLHRSLLHVAADPPYSKLNKGHHVNSQHAR